MKRTTKTWIAACLATVMSLSLFGCGGETKAPDAEPAATETEEQTAETADTGAKLKIGWSVYTMDNDYFRRMTDGVRDKCAELGYELIEHDQKVDEAEMVTGCQNLIAQGIDALVISPCKPEAMGNIVELAHAEDIPVIIVDIGDGGSDKEAIIISDVYGGGQIAGKYALQLLEESGAEGKEVAIVKCEESAVYAIRRGEGFKSVMEEAGYEVVKELTANSKQDEGYTVMQDILASNPNVVAVFAENDPMAAGVAQAIKEAGRDDIIVIGFNGDDVALTAIADGTMQGTVTQDPVAMGALGVELATKACAGEALEYDDPETKEIFAPVGLIGKDGNAIDVSTLE